MSQEELLIWAILLCLAFMRCFNIASLLYFQRGVRRVGVMN